MTRKKHVEESKKNMSLKKSNILALIRKLIVFFPKSAQLETRRINFVPLIQIKFYKQVLT